MSQAQMCRADAKHATCTLYRNKVPTCMLVFYYCLELIFSTAYLKVQVTVQSFCVDGPMIAKSRLVALEGEVQGVETGDM